MYKIIRRKRGGQGVIVTARAMPKADYLQNVSKSGNPGINIIPFNLQGITMLPTKLAKDLEFIPQGSA